MGIDEFHKYQELIRRPATARRTWPMWDSEAWEESKRRFAVLVDVWFHQPLTAAGFRGKSPQMDVRTRTGPPVLDLQRSDTAHFEGLIDFTANWGIWVEGFARRVSKAKRPTPRTSQCPVAPRIGQLLGSVPTMPGGR
jgi:hypothetical protein